MVKVCPTCWLGADDYMVKGNPTGGRHISPFFGMYLLSFVWLFYRHLQHFLHRFLQHCWTASFNIVEQSPSTLLRRTPQPKQQ